MGKNEGLNSLSRLALGMAAALSCGVVCAAAAGVLSAPVVAASLTVAGLIAIVSFRHASGRANAHALVPFRSARPSNVRFTAPKVAELRRQAQSKVGAA